MQLLLSRVLLASLLLEFHKALAFPGPLTCSGLSYPPSQSDITEFLSVQYDYLIVGGGTAGVTVATRLAENGTFHVGIIEAGPFHRVDDLVDIPALWGHSWGNESYDWNFFMAPQVNSDNRSISMPRGRMLGGSSGINGLAWNRASEQEYDAWSAFAASNGWNWSGLLPYFMKAENISTTTPDPYPGISPAERAAAAADFPKIFGQSGPMDASHQIWYPDTLDPYVLALNSMGISTNADPQRGNDSGVYNTLSAIRRPDSTRSYSATRYYCQGLAGSNLHVLVGATASRMYWDNSTDVSGNLLARGIEFIVGSTPYTVNVSKEIIVSGGPVKTPQFLELSGVGNSSILSQYGIEIVLDLPAVGENLQEHVWAGVQWEVKDNITTFDALRNNATFAAAALAEYRTNGSGPYSATDSALTFFWDGDIYGEDRVSDLLQLFDKVAESAPNNSLTAIQYPIQRSWFAEGTIDSQEIIQLSYGAFNVESGKSYAYVLGGSIHPIARGFVHINSSDPLVQPVINPNFLGTEFDTQVTLDTVKFILNISEVSPFSDILSVRTDPSPDVNIKNDTELLSYIRGVTESGGHLIGTAALAPRENQGVVDPYLRVYGLGNVRVVDSSIFPLPIGHTQATVFAIAEKAAEFMLEGH